MNQGCIKGRGSWGSKLPPPFHLDDDKKDNNSREIVRRKADFDVCFSWKLVKRFNFFRIVIGFDIIIGRFDFLEKSFHL